VQTKNGSQPYLLCSEWLTTVLVSRYQYRKLEFESGSDKWRRSRGSLTLIVARREDIVARFEPIQLICRTSSDIRLRCTVLYQDVYIRTKAKPQDIANYQSQPRRRSKRRLVVMWQWKMTMFRCDGEMHIRHGGLHGGFLRLLTLQSRVPLPPATT
jgi:hypothetical protein